jgi:hypothetical protein
LALRSRRCRNLPIPRAPMQLTADPYKLTSRSDPKSRQTRRSHCACASPPHGPRRPVLFDDAT